MAGNSDHSTGRRCVRCDEAVAAGHSADNVPRPSSAALVVQRRCRGVQTCGDGYGA